MDPGHRVDAFPKRVLNSFRTWHKLPDDFSAIHESFLEECCPFIPVMVAPFQKLYYQMTKKTPIMVDNLKRSLRSAKFSSSMREDLQWSRVEKKLSLPLNDDGRYSDQRLCFRSKNMFLVKTYFSFGQRTVSFNEFHVIQTFATPIWYHKRMGEPNESKTKCFHAVDQAKYTKFVLMPHSVYLIEPKTTYVLVSCQKTLFAVDCVSERVARKIKKRYEWREPNEKTFRTKRKRDYLDEPPATPAMEDYGNFYNEEVEISEEEVPRAEDFFFKKPKVSTAPPPPPPPTYPTFYIPEGYVFQTHPNDTPTVFIEPSVTQNDPSVTRIDELPIFIEPSVTQNDPSEIPNEPSVTRIDELPVFTEPSVTQNDPSEIPNDPSVTRNDELSVFTEPFVTQNDNFEISIEDLFNVIESYSPKDMQELTQFLEPPRNEIDEIKDFLKSSDIEMYNFEDLYTYE